MAKDPIAPVVGDMVKVPVKSSWASKINWTQAVALAASVAVVFGVPVEPETQVAIIAGIQGVQATATWILRTWFTKEVTPSSVPTTSVVK